MIKFSELRKEEHLFRLLSLFYNTMPIMSISFRYFYYVFYHKQFILNWNWLNVNVKFKEMWTFWKQFRKSSQFGFSRAIYIWKIKSKVVRRGGLYAEFSRFLDFFEKISKTPKVFRLLIRLSKWKSKKKRNYEKNQKKRKNFQKKCNGLRFRLLYIVEGNLGITKSIKTEVIPMGNFDSA